MGVSCVYKVLASAFVALVAAGCASTSFEPGERQNDSLQRGITGTLAGDEAQEFVRKCHDALVGAAEPYGLTKAVSSPARVDDIVGPVWVTTVYQRRGGPETRSAVVDCHLDMSGSVVAFTQH
jgi:hypothetical protein